MSFFDWDCELNSEMELPLPLAWDFCLDPNNWLKWENRIESYAFGENLSVGSLIKGKIKKKNAYISILVTGLQQHEKYETLIKVPFYKQRASLMFSEISSRKTGLKMKVFVKSPFAFFMKSYFERKVESLNAKMLDVLLKEVKVSL